MLPIPIVVVIRKMVISTTYSCAISSSASDVDRLLLEVVAELSGTSVTFSAAAASDVDASPSKVVTAVGTLTNAFAGRSDQIALVGVESVLKKWFGEVLDAGGRAAAGCRADAEAKAVYAALRRTGRLTPLELDHNIALLDARLARACGKERESERERGNARVTRATGAR